MGQQKVLFLFLLVAASNSIRCAVVPSPVVPEVAAIDPELLPVNSRMTSTILESVTQPPAEHETKKEPALHVTTATTETLPEFHPSVHHDETLDQSDSVPVGRKETEPFPTPIPNNKPTLQEGLSTLQPEVLENVSDVNQTLHDDVIKPAIEEAEPRFWPYYGGWFGYSPFLMGGGGGGGGGGGWGGGGGGGGGGKRR